MKKKNIIFLLIIILFSSFLFLIGMNNYFRENFDNVAQENKLENDSEAEDPKKIPIVLICWNNLTFVRNMVNQIKKYDQPIILLDNNSNYQPLFDYYDEIKNELQDKIEIRRYDTNYGHKVYLKMKDTLPDIYILSDPDLELNKNMPSNFVEILLSLSNKHKVYKVGLALDISDSEKFIPCDNYYYGYNIQDWEGQYWRDDRKLENDENYQVYDSSVDTTFCLINNKYLDHSDPQWAEYKGIRVAGDFTVKHLPWYNNYIEDNIPEDELNNWKSNNVSTSLLEKCKK
jgi:hypothetical protein